MSNIVTIDHLPGRTIAHEGRNYLFFSGTAYLGLPQHPAFQQLMAGAVARYGTAFGSSRNGNLQLDVFEKAEQLLAADAGAPAALTLSSGMMAGQTVVNWLRAQAATFLYSPNAHPALWDSPTVTLPATSFTDWTASLPDQLRTLPPGPVAVLLNSLDAAHSAYYSFDWVNDLPADRAVTFVVDDSHGLGVLSDGQGIWPQIPQRPNVTLLVTASLAKAIGLSGGIILGEAETLANLRRTAFFGACSPMAPALLDAYTQAGDLYAEGRARLRDNVALAETLLLPTGLFSHATGYPVFFTEANDLYAHLLDAGILIYSFAYPTPPTAQHTYRHQRLPYGPGHSDFSRRCGQLGK